MATTRRGRGRGRRGGDGPNPIDVHVGQRVRLRRNELGISQEKLGEALGLTFQQVQKYERGTNRIGASRLYETAQVLGVAVSYFYEGFESAASLSSGFAEPPPAAFESDPLRRRETMELVGAYYDVADPALRRRFFELARTLAATIGPSEEE